MRDDTSGDLVDEDESELDPEERELLKRRLIAGKLRAMIAGNWVSSR